MLNILGEDHNLDNKSVSATLRELGTKPLNGKTTIAQIVGDFHENGLLLSTIFFALPVAIPLPYPPGFSTILGTPLLILGIQMVLGSKQVRLPKKIGEYAVTNAFLKKISDKMVPLVEALEKYMKQRYGFARSVYCEQLVGLLVFVASMMIMVPLPLTNAIPAAGITIMSLGLLSRDGLVVLIGGVVAIVGIIIALLVILASWMAIKYFFLQLFRSY